MASAMERIRSVFTKTAEADEYAPLTEELDEDEDEDEETTMEDLEDSAFSWLEYAVFLLLGIAMLWSWNMFLAAAPYFAKRFHSDDWILAHYQSSITSVSTCTSFVAMLTLANIQSKASYQGRVAWGLLINITAFCLLALSTTFFRHVSAATYLAFILAMVLASSFATSLIQNGTFALSAGFGHPSYIQAIMTGQAVAGVLPPIAQIVTVLAIPSPDGSTGISPPELTDPAMPPPQESSTSAFIYFLTASFVSILALLSLIPLVRRHALLTSRSQSQNMLTSITSLTSMHSTGERKTVPLTTLYKKLHWLAISVFTCFAVSMFFPVYTSQILSVYPSPSTAPPLLRPATFIPLAFLCWNTGDLTGRLLTLLPFNLKRTPALLFVFALARLGFIPLYLLCNIRGKGAVINSDLFYLLVVQIGFGLTNGWVGSSCMMAAPEAVDEAEREATGGFMGLNLVAGLTVGSLLSFTAPKG